uniref:Growth arrest and DNA damage inducible gamma n=1 Tax=Cynoglossus semilaevis TaxID=244447 RepID=A0A3P8WFP0_CYNSE
MSTFTSLQLLLEQYLKKKYINPAANSIFSLFVHRDPDSVSFCVLGTDEEFECDIALQIHFTLIQSFCFDNDISIVRVSDTQRLAEIVGGDKVEQLEDAHCVLITNPVDGSWEDPALEKLHLFCEESRRLNDWLPEINLPGR